MTDQLEEEEELRRETEILESTTTEIVLLLEEEQHLLEEIGIGKGGETSMTVLLLFRPKGKGRPGLDTRGRIEEEVDLLGRLIGSDKKRRRGDGTLREAGEGILGMRGRGMGGSREIPERGRGGGKSRLDEEVMIVS